MFIVSKRFCTALLVATLLPLSLCAEVWAQATSGTISWDDALDQEPAWYESTEAVRIADNVLLYQHESGGWPKNIDMADIRLIEIEDPSLPGGHDRVVGFDPIGSSPLWARFYEIGTNYPMFLDREGNVHYALSQIPHERRMGYEWLGDWPRALLEEDYPAWREKWGIE